MARIDVIVCWPRNCDYPLWRKFIRDERERFNRVFAVLTHHDGLDYSDWLRVNLREVEFIEVMDQRGDWRDEAVNLALDASEASRVWFTEQDFFIRDEETFWSAKGPVVGFCAGDGRLLHPASLFVDRELIDKTSSYFGPEPIDHFYIFAEELNRLAPITFLPEWSFEHMQGVSQNHFLVDKGEDSGVFRRPRFRNYLRSCLASGVPLHPEWEQRARREVGNVFLPEEKVANAV